MTDLTACTERWGCSFFFNFNLTKIIYVNSLTVRKGKMGASELLCYALIHLGQPVGSTDDAQNLLCRGEMKQPTKYVMVAS